jgi:ribosomal protein L20A (L18A)
LRDELEYYVDGLPEILEREPSRGDELLFAYTSSRYREIYEHVYKKPSARTQGDYVERGSIKIEDVVKLLESNVRRKATSYYLKYWCVYH